MLKKIKVKFLVLSLVFLMTSADLFAQTTRIRFAPGRSSATVSGTLQAGGSRTYILRAGAGQYLEAKLRSRNGRVRFEDNSTVLMTDTDYNGDYHIEVINNGGSATSFTLTVSVD